MSSPTMPASKPEEAGVDPEKLEAVFARAKRDVDDGVLDACSVAVARNGILAGSRSFGRAIQGGDEKEVTDDTLFTVFSCTKGIVAAAVWTLFEDGLLRLDERVAGIVPEFGTNGKQNITVEQVLLHISGFPRQVLHPRDWEDRDARLAAFSRWTLDWEPGTRFEYHATSAHWVLVEILARRTGQEFRAFIRERILDPMGLPNLYVGMPDSELGRVADVKYMSPPEPPPGGWTEVTPEALLNSNNRVFRTSGLPGGGGVGRAQDLALFYQPLINGGVTASGTRVLKPETIEFATKVRTKASHTEPLLGHPVNRALSVTVAGDDGNKHLRGFGHSASPRAFGHAGAGGQIAWGDPETGISVGYTTNCFVDVMTQGRRTTAIGSLAAQCAL